MTDFAQTRACFHLPEGIIYLDGNSLGPMPLSAQQRATQVIQHEWGEQLIRAWNQSAWMQQPKRVGSQIARLIGAEADNVVVGDTLSIKIVQAMAAALRLNPERKVILSDNGNFPTDLYMVQGLIDHLQQGHSLKTPEPEAVEDLIDDSVAVLMLTQVDYRSGRLHDMQRLTAKAKEHGVITIWDLAHSAGAVPLDLAAAGVDFAAGCTYKYLNGGPGAPAFIYVAPHLENQASPLLAGWMGHAEPFAFLPDYYPAAGVERMRVGTPPVIAMSILEAALEIWETVDMEDVRRKSLELSELFIREVESRCPELRLASPRDPQQRGSQVSFRFEHSYPAMQALIDYGVIGDFRAPDMMRFGFTPLYIDAGDVLQAVDTLTHIMQEAIWQAPKYQQRQAVT